MESRKLLSSKKVVCNHERIITLGEMLDDMSLSHLCQIDTFLLRNYVSSSRQLSNSVNIYFLTAACTTFQHVKI